MQSMSCDWGYQKRCIYSYEKKHTCLDAIEIESSGNDADGDTDYEDDGYVDSNVDRHAECVDEHNVSTNEGNSNRKMYLIDQQSMDKLKDDNWKKPVEHMLDVLKRKEDNSWQKPIEKRTKTKLSLQMKRILESDEDDYEKAKLYQKTLSRLLKLNKKI
jgi:hypothetical protein